MQIKEKFQYFNFKEIENGVYFISNDFAKNLILDETAFQKLIVGDIDKENDAELYQILYDNFFIIDKNNFQDARASLLHKKSFGVRKGRLLVLKVTNFCNYNCIYCQASSDVKNGDTKMSKETAFNAVNMIVSTNIERLIIEFQGGEPLSNFELIQEVVEYAENIKKTRNIEITYRLMSNLSLLTDEMLNYCVRYKISVGTSLDGPKELTNQARILKDGTGIFDITASKRLEFESKMGFKTGLISTVPKSSLSHAKEYIDFYISEDMDYNIRPLFRLGKADKIWDEIGYTAEEFLKFYEDCLNYTFEHLKEHPESRILDKRTAIFLEGIIYGEQHDIEISSPCGSVTDMVSIDWNGDVMACEGSKMVVGEKRQHFILGNVNTDDAVDIFYGKKAQEILRSTNSENDMRCSRCAYAPYCGNCEVERYISEDAHLFNCKINEGMLDFIVRTLYKNEDGKGDILRKWAEMAHNRKFN